MGGYLTASSLPKKISQVHFLPKKKTYKNEKRSYKTTKENKAFTIKTNLSIWHLTGYLTKYLTSYRSDSKPGLAVHF